MTGPTDAYLQLDGLTKRYDGTVAVDHVDASVARGELVSLLGPSGCGKTTLLRLIAGFLVPVAAASGSAAGRSNAIRRTGAGWAWCSRTTHCFHT